MVAALELPLNLFPINEGGPSLPKDWQQRAQVSQPAHRDLVDDDSPWQRKRSAPWVTVLAAWQETVDVDADTSGTRQQVAEQGAQLAAYATCEGSVWIFRDARLAQQSPASPAARAASYSSAAKPTAPASPSARFTTRASSPTPSHVSASSRRHAASQSMSHAAPLFAGFSPSTSSFSGEFEPSELPMPIQDAPVQGQVARGEDAEMLLEAQYHAGERKGFMGALGLAHTPVHHAHAARTHEAVATRSRRPSGPLLEPSIDRSYANSGSQSAHAATALPARIASPQGPLQQLQPRVALQGPSQSSVVGLGPCNEGLLVLQASGSLALWSANGVLLASAILGCSQRQPHQQYQQTKAASASSTQASLRERKARLAMPLAGLPGFMPSPDLRSASEAATSSALDDHTCDFTQLSSVVGAASGLWCTWDAARHVAFVVHPTRQGIETLWSHRLPSAVSAPAARTLADGFVEFLWLNESGVLCAEAVPPPALQETLQEEERVRGTLEAAAAFFRRNQEREVLNDATHAPAASTSSPADLSTATSQNAGHLAVQEVASSGASSPGRPGAFASGAAALFRREGSALTPAPQPSTRSRRWDARLIGSTHAHGLHLQDDGTTLELWNDQGSLVSCLAILYEHAPALTSFRSHWNRQSIQRLTCSSQRRRTLRRCPRQQRTWHAHDQLTCTPWSDILPSQKPALLMCKLFRPLPMVALSGSL